MVMRILVAGLASLAITAHAAPIVFFNTTFDTVAVAIAENVADVDSAASPPSALPLVSSAVAVGTTDLATADAFADMGFLSTAASATGIAGPSSVATSHFSGMFNNGGTTNLSISLSSFGFSSGDALFDGYLIVSLIRGGMTLVDQVRTGNDALNIYYQLPGGTSILDLLLVSDATVFGVGDAFNSASATFGGTIPLPATWLLVLIGMAALGVLRRTSTAGVRA